MIKKEDNVINEWKIYSAEQFQKVFDIKEEWDCKETDEDYITRHLEEDNRLFRLTFTESIRDNAYEEYWNIEEIENE